MMRKIFGAKSITHLIYGLLMLMPFVAIGVKCAYAVVNKNAYQSYSNYNADNTQYDIISNYSDLVVGQRYRFVSNNNALGVTSISGRLVYEDVNILSSTFNASTNTQIENSTYLGMWYGSNYNSNFIRFNENSNLQLSNNQITFEFTFVGFSNISESNNLPYYFGTMITKSFLTDTTNTLDNVFYYAIDEVIEENNIGLLDFTSWFDGWILSDNAMNNRFIGFANWYMNFAFLVSACYVLFLCMLWFVNFARRLLERGMNYDF